MFRRLKEITGSGEKIAIIALALLLVGASVWRGAAQNKAGPEVTRSGFEEPLNLVEEPHEITVHLIGEVARPGIYHLTEGARVYELLERAGGLTLKADSQSVNQARPLFDGEQVCITGIAPEGESGASSELKESAAGKVNINTAGVNELKTLPGIGEVKAGQIVAHREKHGPFKEPRELVDVSGIGEKTFENIADLITIY